MLVTFAVLILLITPLVLMIIQRRAEDFKSTNLVAGGAALLAWLLLVLAYAQLPIEFTLQKWGPENLYPNPPALLIDKTSWAFAISLVGLGGGVAFTNRKRVQLLPIWVLSLTAIGVLASFAANPIALLYLWTLSDILILLCLLHGASHAADMEKIVNSFALRLLSLVFIMGASLISYSQGIPLTFAAIQPSVSAYLVIGAVLRLGLGLPSSSLEHIQGFEPILRAVPVATSLTLIARTAEAGLPAHLQAIFLYFIIAAALLGGLAWALSDTKKVSPSMWIWGMGALSVAAALLGYPLASLVWGIAALLLGSWPFWISEWTRPLSVLGIVCFVGLTALPFTPTWPGAKMYTAGGWGALLGVAQGLLAGGYLKIVLDRHKTRVKLETWEILPSVFGIAILPVTQVVAVAFLGGLSWNLALGMEGWWWGLLALGVAAGVLAWNHLSVPVPESLTKGVSVLGRIPRLIRQALRILYDFISRLSNILTAVLEGEGGVMWTLLGILLVITILASLRGG